MDKVTDGDLVKLRESLSAVSSVKQKAIKRYIKNTMRITIKSDNSCGKRCQWCTACIDGLGAFCSKECENKHIAAEEVYEARQADKEEQRWAR